MKTALNSSVLVLNKNYIPICIINAKRAFVMLWQNIATVISIENEDFNNYDFNSWAELSKLKQELNSTTGLEDWVETPKLVLEVPRIIRLLNFSFIPKRKVKLSRKNIMTRDNYTCQYCYKKKKIKELNIDHVFPQSRGGRTIWTNLVTACFNCNTIKANKTPEEAKMFLKRKPKEPRILPFIKTKVCNKKYYSWKHFISEVY